MRKIGLIILIVIGLYYLKYQPAINVVNNALPFWNDTLDFILNFKERYPWIYMFLPLLFFWLLSRNKREEEDART